MNEGETDHEDQKKKSTEKDTAVQDHHLRGDHHRYHHADKHQACD